MVIHIVTHSAKTFGNRDQIRTGAIEEFYSAEIKHGKKFTDEDGGLFYAGIGKYTGAGKKTPINFPLDFPSRSIADWLRVGADPQRLLDATYGLKAGKGCIRARSIGTERISAGFLR